MIANRDRQIEGFEAVVHCPQSAELIRFRVQPQGGWTGLHYPARNSIRCDAPSRSGVVIEPGAMSAGLPAGQCVENRMPKISDTARPWNLI